MFVSERKVKLQTKWPGVLKIRKS